MLLNLLNYFYLCLWAILLIHCLKSTRFYPIFGQGFGKKIFWVFTFAFFNPILSILYIFCFFSPMLITWKKGRLETDKTDKKAEIIESKPEIKKAIAIAVFIFTFIILVLFEIPRSSKKIQSVTQFNKAEENVKVESPILKSGLNLGFIDAKNKIQTISSSPANDNTRVSFSNIALICKNEEYFLEKVAQKVQKTLFILPYVDKVTCYTKKQLPDSNSVQPDLFIALEMQDMNEDKFLLNRKINVKIMCSASSSISDALSDSRHNTTAGKIDSFTIKSQLHYTSATFCIECPGTEYEHEVKDISHILTEAIRKQFEIQIKNNEKTSEILYGSDTEQSL